ncbi:MAG: hypothetical protein M3Q55_14140 [Acidobacteriota bacterium]|nr:hypothetical protein [Acidobacteriota bacterium]
MRARTSATLVVMLALLASPAATLACAWDCVPAAGAVMPVEAQATAGDCHRETPDTPSDIPSLAAAPHDCSAHGAVPNPPLTSLTAPARESALRLSWATGPAPRAAALALRETVVGSQSPHDLAPPGISPALTARLRV